MSRAVEAWERFWFEPEQTSTLALLRIFFGMVVLAWTVSLIPDAYDFFSSDGIVPEQPDYGPAIDAGRWGVLELVPGRTAVALVMAALSAGSICLIVGWHSRLASVVVFVGLISLQRRNPFVFNSGDSLLRIIAFYLMLAPAGASLSVDRWRQAKNQFWDFPARAPWAMRLIQIQLSVIYISTVWAKARGATWGDGTAVSYALRIEDLARFPVPLFLSDSQLVSNLMTYGTLGIELALGILVWNRKLRPWVLVLGLGLHLGIDYGLRVGFFSYAMFTLYVAFLSPRTASEWLLRVRSRLGFSTVTPAGTPQEARQLT